MTAAAVLTETERQKRLSQMVSACGVEMMQLARFVAERGCQVPGCGVAASSVWMGPQLMVENMRIANSRAGRRPEVFSRVTLQVRVRCQAHDPSLNQQLFREELSQTGTDVPPEL